MEFSSQQLKVINSRGKNILVSAAAGSGKTTVLVERVTALLREGANIDEILVVTFTRAASRDMLAKLYKRISEEAQLGDRHMREQLERLELSHISTLHSFCSDLIRDMFETAKIDPKFRISEKSDDKSMTDEALDDLMEQSYAQGGYEFEMLCAGRKDEQIRDMVLELSEFLSTRPDRNEWYENCVALMEGSGEKWADVLVNAARALIEESKTFGEYALRLCYSPSGPMEFADAIQNELGQIIAAESLDYGGIRNAAMTFKTSVVRSKNSAADPDKIDAVKALRDRMKENFPAKIKKLFSLPLKTSLDDIKTDIPAFKKLFELACALEDRLMAMRREKGVMNYNDLERTALELMGHEDVREKLKRKYSYVFVDEYQDTSDLQEAIVSAIARDDNRFMVGDVKQSIYRFRNAVPELFMQKYADYALGGKNELIVLSQNFRSMERVLEFVNLLFERVMCGGTSEIIYDEDARLNPGKDAQAGGENVELMLIDKSDEADTFDEFEADEPYYNDEADDDGENSDDAVDLDELKDAEREALLIARRIYELKDEDKSLKYRDICVITRNKRNILSPMASMLASQGIPSYADESENAFDAIEVAVVLNVLKLLINRRKEIELISVLRSPMFLLSANELALLRISNPDGTLFEALEICRDKIAGADKFLTLYESWRAAMRTLSLNKLIYKILDDTGYYTFMGALPGGRHRQANIDLLCEKALSYEQSRSGSVSGFIDYVNKLKLDDDGLSAHELSESDDVVRLMTAYKSKGLEFKVVFAAMLSTDFKHKGRDGICLIDRDLGIAFPHIDTNLNSVRSTISERAIKTFGEQKERAEQLRVLYVTLTRAMQRLIMVGSVRSLNKSITQWRLGASQPNLYKNSMDIIGAAAMNCPGCEALGGDIDDSKPYVALSIHNASELVPRKTGDESELLIKLNQALESDLSDDEITAAYNWVYPHADRVYAPLKLSVTGLERELTGLNSMPREKTQPAFISGEDVSVYTQRGTAVHTALQNLDYAPFKPITQFAEAQKEALSQIEQMVNRGILSEDEQALVRPSLIAGFMLGEIGQMLLNSERVEREWRFTMMMDIGEALDKTEPAKINSADNQQILVQGSIDLCFLKDDKWVLVDYKTERGNTDQEIIDRYGNQLRVYALALKRLTDKEVDQIIICLVSQGRLLRLKTE